MKSKTYTNAVQAEPIDRLLRGQLVEYITHSEAQGKALIDIPRFASLAHGRDIRTAEAVTLRFRVGDLQWREIKP